MITKIGYFILAVLTVFYMHKWAASQSPCSVWAEHPEQCSSDFYGDR